MTAAAVLAIALAAGCFSDRGLGIEVDVGDTGATKVELYLGKTRCAPNNSAQIDCTAIAPPDSAVALRGDIWFRDDLLPYSAVVSGRTAAFQLRADTPTTLPVVIAVGLVTTSEGVRAVGAATLQDIAIPVDGARVATIALAAVKPVRPEQSNTGGLTEERAMVWTKSMPPSSCVVVEHWNNGQVSRTFVVPSDDPDCDDVKPECNPAAYRGTSAAGGSSPRPHCVAPADGSRCVLGNLGCDDKQPDLEEACVAQPRQVCVPQELCGCPALEDDCVRTAIAESTQVPRVICQVPTTMALGICGGNDSDMIDLSQHLGAGCGRQPKLSSLELTEASASHRFGAAELELSPASPDCTFKIAWKSGTLTISETEQHGFIVLETSTGGMLLPMLLKFRLEQCAGQPFTCELDDPMPNSMPDSMWSCEL